MKTALILLLLYTLATGALGRSEESIRGMLRTTELQDKSLYVVINKNTVPTDGKLHELEVKSFDAGTDADLKKKNDVKEVGSILPDDGDAIVAWKGNNKKIKGKKLKKDGQLDLSHIDGVTDQCITVWASSKGELLKVGTGGGNCHGVAGGELTRGVGNIIVTEGYNKVKLALNPVKAKAKVDTDTSNADRASGKLIDIETIEWSLRSMKLAANELIESDHEYRFLYHVNRVCHDQDVSHLVPDGRNGNAGHAKGRKRVKKINEDKDAALANALRGINKKDKKAIRAKRKEFNEAWENDKEDEYKDVTFGLTCTASKEVDTYTLKCPEDKLQKCTDTLQTLKNQYVTDSGISPQDFTNYYNVAVAAK